MRYTIYERYDILPGDPQQQQHKRNNLVVSQIVVIHELGFWM